MLGKIHIGKKDLGMDDAIYRDMLSQWGLASAKDATMVQLEAILSHLKKSGFTPKKSVRKYGKKPRPLMEPGDKQALLGKIEALLADGGYHWNYAHGISKKMFKVDRLEWCDWRQLRKIVAALEYNKKRAGNKKGVTHAN